MCNSVCRLETSSMAYETVLNNQQQKFLGRGKGPKESKDVYDYQFKVLIVGDSGVGKSSLLVRFCNKHYMPYLVPTIGLDLKIKTVNVNGKRVQLRIWDTAGQDRFHTLTKSYYRQANGVMVVYDSTNISSLNSVSNWVNAIDLYAEEGLEGIEKILIANKSDLKKQREVSSYTGSEVASSLGMKFLETSAIATKNVDLAFEQLAEAMLARELNHPRNKVDPNIITGDSLTEDGQTTSKCCSS